MPRKGLSLEPIVAKLRQIDVPTSQGKTTGQACREAAISEQSCYRWRKEYGGLPIEQTKRLKVLEKENARLNLAAAGILQSMQCLSARQPKQFGIIHHVAVSTMN